MQHPGLNGVITNFTRLYLEFTELLGLCHGEIWGVGWLVWGMMVKLMGSSFRESFNKWKGLPENVWLVHMYADKEVAVVLAGARRVPSSLGHPQNMGTKSGLVCVHVRLAWSLYHKWLQSQTLQCKFYKHLFEATLKPNCFISIFSS